MVERFIRAIEDLRQVLRSYHGLDEATKTSIRHQLYTRGGGFAKSIFKETDSLAADYQALEGKLGHAPLPNTVSEDIQKAVMEWSKGKMTREDQVAICQFIKEGLGDKQ